VKNSILLPHREQPASRRSLSKMTGAASCWSNTIRIGAKKPIAEAKMTTSDNGTASSIRRSSSHKVAAASRQAKI